MGLSDVDTAYQQAIIEYNKKKDEVLEDIYKHVNFIK